MTRQLFDEYGNYMRTIPGRAVASCSHSGDCTAEVEYWQSKLGFVCPRELAVKYLNEYGAWDDLDTVPDATINQRVLWVACCDIKESGEWYGLMI